MLRKSGRQHLVTHPVATAVGAVGLYYSRGFPFCGYMAAQRDAFLIGCRLHSVISFLIAWSYVAAVSSRAL
jgi:hypothetical protein